MQYCDGQSIAVYLSNPNRKVDSGEVFLMFQQMVSGIEFIHKKGIIHRDIKLILFIYNPYAFKLKYILNTRIFKLFKSDQQIFFWRKAKQ